MPSNHPLVYVVILGWNHLRDTAECVDSVLRMPYPNFRVLVVDNGSTDGAPDMLKRDFPMVELVLSGENLGIARGYNLGLSRALEAGAEQVLLLNNDTKVDQGLLSALVASAETDKEAGVFMPKVLLYGDEKRLWSVGASRKILPPRIVLTGLNQIDSPKFSQPREIQYAPSCALLIRRQVLEAAGMFDPGYFMYFDDWDFCERVRECGFKILYTPEGRIWHKVSASTQNDAKPSKWWYVLGKSTVRFYSRHRRPILLTMPGHVAWITVRELAKRNVRGLPAYWMGIKDGLLIGRRQLGAAPDSSRGAFLERIASRVRRSGD